MPSFYANRIETSDIRSDTMTQGYPHPPLTSTVVSFTYSCVDICTILSTKYLSPLGLVLQFPLGLLFLLGEVGLGRLQLLLQVLVLQLQPGIK